FLHNMFLSAHVSFRFASHETLLHFGIGFKQVFVLNCRLRPTPLGQPELTGRPLLAMIDTIGI
ncbi:MAG: hypothetical protein ACNA71_09825, partial [Kiritimatiellia bacterium]